MSRLLGTSRLVVDAIVDYTMLKACHSLEIADLSFRERVPGIHQGNCASFMKRCENVSVACPSVWREGTDTFDFSFLLNAKI